MLRSLRNKERERRSPHNRTQLKPLDSEMKSPQGFDGEIWGASFHDWRVRDWRE
jgi:hypothetical protein